MDISKIKNALLEQKKIHLSGNLYYKTQIGRVGRMIMFRECLNNNLMPFYIEDRNKDFYLRGLKEYKEEKQYLIDTIKNSQDNYEKMVHYFLEENT